MGRFINLFSIIKNDKPSARIPNNSIYCPRCKKELIVYFYKNKIYKVCPIYEICRYYYITEKPIADEYNIEFNCNRINSPTVNKIARDLINKFDIYKK